MTVSSLTSLMGSETIEDIVADLQEKQQQALSVTTGSGGSGGVMARNYYDADHQESRYLEAKKQSFQEARQAKNDTLYALFAALDSLDGAGGGMREAMIRKRNFEAAKKGADEIQQHIDQKTAEATAPKDAEGNPLPGAADGTSGTETVIPAAAAGSAAAPAPSAPAATPEPSPSSSPAPSSGGKAPQSVDVVV